jgi:hypothetical protein
MYDFMRSMGLLSEQAEFNGQKWLIVERLRDGFCLAVETDDDDDDNKTISVPASVKLIKLPDAKEEDE